MKNNNFICWFSPKDNERKKKEESFSRGKDKSWPAICLHHFSSLT